MEAPPIPQDEEQRLALLRACNIIYTPAEEAFDDIARLAADICGTEIALVTLVDADYQWFKARVGIEATGTPRDLSFCGHCINLRHPLVIEDTLLDRRFVDNPLVTGEPHVRFYTGVPLILNEVSAIGALSVADRRPRSLAPKELGSLERLARQVARELRLRIELARPAWPSTRSTALAPGAAIGARWTIVREVGCGTFGVVYEGRDEDGARVAIKVLHPMWQSSLLLVERFVREARILMRLETPHVGKLLDVGNLDAGVGAIPYLVLEYLEGIDLGQVIAERGRVPARDALAWCADACAGLHAAHGIGVIHRDLKPSNVFLARQTDSVVATAKVLDFGIAASEAVASDSTRLTGAGAIMGTPLYMAPEQTLSPSDVDPRADVWSMGVVLYELLTGRLPFAGDTDLQIFANALTKPPTPMREHVAEGVPPAAEAVVLRCLRRERDERYSSIRALEDALRAALA